jgi:NADH-quinone oxidoreductase subunit F
MSSNLSELSGRKGLQNNLFERLGEVLSDQVDPTSEQLEKLSAEFLVGMANLTGTASFYDFTRPENRGKKAYVCNGSACLCAGTQPDVYRSLQAHFAQEEIGEMCCLGRCHENSAFHVNGVNYSGDAVNKLEAILETQQQEVIRANDHYHALALGTSVLMQPDSLINETVLRDMLAKPPEVLLEEIRKSGLRGRGGAGFPMAFKLDACMKAQSDTKFIVCNADEGDPGAYSDRYLLEERPGHVVLGMMMAAYITGASWGVLYIRAEYPESVAVCEQLLNELRSASLIGKNILNTGFDFECKVIKAQGAYICGEETALLSSIEGQRPEVRVRPPYPAQKGLFNKPTVVNNVETLACLPFIFKEGGERYAQIGNGKSTGTKLVSLDGHFHKPGIYEVDMGTSLRTVIDDCGGGFSTEIKAMHIGGPLGGLVPVSKIDDLTVDFESFSQQGFLLGHASIVCIPSSFPVINYLEHLFRFTAHESCGKCFPCRLGSTRGYELIEHAKQSGQKINRQLLNDLLETLEIGSLCALGGGLPLPVKNAIRYFGDELDEWIE